MVALDKRTLLQRKYKTLNMAAPIGESVKIKFALFWGLSQVITYFCEAEKAMSYYSNIVDMLVGSQCFFTFSKEK